MLQVRDGGLQTAAVGAELPGVDGQQAAGLQGVPGGGQRVQHHHRKIRQLREQRLSGKTDLRRVPHHQTGLHKGLRVLMELKQHGFHPLFNAPSFAEEHHGVRRQVVRASGGVRVDQAQIAVQSIDLRTVPEAFRVSPESLGNFLSVFFLSVLDGQLFDLLRQMGKPAGGQSRQNFRRRQQQCGGYIFRPPLGAGVEQSQRVDLIVEKLAPHRLLHQRGEHVQNTAPQSELAHALHLIAAAIPRL